MSGGDCPSRSELLAFLAGRLSETDADAMAAHVDSCDPCRNVLRQLDDGDDELLRNLRSATGDDALLDESQCWEIVDDLKEMASDPLFAGLGSESEPEVPLPGPSGPLGQLGDYRILEKLGRGGMGEVYKALHVRLDRTVAIKVLPHNRAEDRRAIARFEREMMAVGKLDHPNIVRAMDAREIGGTRFLVMEFVDGYNLADVARDCARLEVADACELMRRTALGLQCAHESGLIHRDIKPSNLMLSREGEVKVLDLGLARFRSAQAAADETADETSHEMTMAGQAMGTADYMAPEQASDSHSVDIRADIYSLGCTLYRLLAGQPPFDDSSHRSAFEKMVAHTREPVPPITQFRTDIPVELLAVLDRMLAKDPNRRFATPIAAAAALEPFAEYADLPALAAEAGEGSGVSSKTARSLPSTRQHRGSPGSGTKRTPRTADQPGLVTLAARRRRRWIRLAELSALLVVGVLLVLGTIAISRRQARRQVAGTGDQAAESQNEDSRPAEPKQPSGTPPEEVPPEEPTHPTEPVEAPPEEPIHPTEPVEVPPEEPTHPTEPAEVPPQEPSPPTEPVEVSPEEPDRPTEPVEVPPEEPTRPTEPVESPKRIADEIPREVREPVEGAPLGKLALVTEPALVDGVVSWTIETRAPRGAVLAVEYSPDGRLLATGGSDGAVRVWNTATEQLEQLLAGHDGPVACLAWSPDGSVLASGSHDRTIRLWDVATGDVRRTLRGHLGQILAAAWVADTRLLATAGSDQTVRVWDVVSGSPRHTLRGHSATINAVVCSPDGATLASGGTDKTVALWDLASGDMRHTLSGFEGNVADVACSPDGKLVAVAVENPLRDVAVQLWNTADGKLLRSMPAHRFGHGRVAWSSDGQLLAATGAAGDSKLRVWDAATGTLVSQCDKPSGVDAEAALCFSPDNTALTAGGTRGAVLSCRALSGELLGELPAGVGPLRQVAFSADHSFLAAAYQDGVVRLWHVDSGESVGRLNCETGALGPIAWSSDGTMLATGYADGQTVDLWDVTSQQQTRQLRSPRGAVTNIAWSPDGAQVATGGMQAQLWDAQSGAAVASPRGYGNGMAWSRDGSRLAIGAGGDVRLCDAMGSQVERALFSSQSSVRRIAWSPDGRAMAAATADCKLYVWETASGRLQHTFSEHTTPIVCLRWIEDGATLVSGTTQVVCFWQIATGKLLRKLAVDGGDVAGGVERIASRQAGVIRLRHPEDGRVLRTLIATNDGTVALSPEGHYRTLAEAENELLYLVQTAAGQQTLTPAEFATRHGWGNLPDSVGPPLPEPEPEPEEEPPPEERSILVGEKADEPAG